MFSPDAQRLLVVGGDAVAVLDASSRAEQQRLAIPAVMAAALSPKGTFLITFQRPSKDESGQGEALRWGLLPLQGLCCHGGGQGPLHRVLPHAPVGCMLLQSSQCCCAETQSRALPPLLTTPQLTATSRCGAWRTASCC